MIWILRIFLSHDVKFFEDIFPYLDKNGATIKPNHVALPYESANATFDTYFGESEVSQFTAVPPLVTSQPMSSPPANSLTFVVSSSSSDDTMVQQALGNDAPKLGRGHREKFLLVKLRDFVTHTVIKVISHNNILTPFFNETIFYFKSDLFNIIYCSKSTFENYCYTKPQKTLEICIYLKISEGLLSIIYKIIYEGIIYFFIK